MDMHVGLRPIDALLTRRSVGALDDPAPAGSDLDLIIDAGLRAPDHGRLRPWRFVVIQGEARKAFGDVLAQAAKARDPANADGLIERHRAWPLRCPLIIAMGAIVQAGHRIPETEQILSAGAAAMNMLNAVHMLGYGGIWVTGVNTYDAQVNAMLGFMAPSRLVGFLMVGTPKSPAQAGERPARAAHITYWTPPSEGLR